MVGWIKKQMDGWMDRNKKNRMDGWMDKKNDGWWMDRKNGKKQMDGWMDG